MFALAIRPSQFFITLRRERYIKSLRPAYKDYIDVWFSERKLKSGGQLPRD